MELELCNHFFVDVEVRIITWKSKYEAVCTCGVFGTVFCITFLLLPLHWACMLPVSYSCIIANFQYLSASDIFILQCPDVDFDNPLRVFTLYRPTH